ncbi:MAG: tRNA pseudouridine(38-40) synthase TruA [bacterium]|nr:tRNA pseudouridine(38-40) synthase TruA [bacterium]
MYHYRIVLGYDGLKFHGWQVQPGLRTVQLELESVLAQIMQEPVRAQSAGRTDAGVHALGQCASFTLSKEIATYRLLGSLRRLLPTDISPVFVERVPAGFHARFSATARFYTYRLALRPCAPFRHTHWLIHRRLDMGAMQHALLILRDATDFEGFCTREAAEKGTTCHLRQLELKLVGDELHFLIGANRFLHNMVRIITGTIVDIGLGRFEPSLMAQMLESGDRTLGGQTAPSQGLFFRSVEYPVESLLLDPASER